MGFEDDRNLKDFPNIDKMPALLKMCPKCGKLSLELIDNEVKCSKCGYNSNVTIG